MNLSRVPEHFFLFLILGSISLSSLGDELHKEKYASISDQLRKGHVFVTVLGSGGHEGECISMYLENPSKDTAFVLIEPGRVLSSLDTAVQDILITRKEMLALAPGEGRNVNIFGFCCQASNGSPDSAEVFRVGEMADSTVVVLAKYLSGKDNNFPEDAIQQAVWCLTDDYSVSEIWGVDLASTNELRELVAGLKGTDEDWRISEETPIEELPFSYYSKSLTGNIDLEIPKDCIVNIYICDKEGQRWDEFEKNVPYKAGSYEYSFKLTTTNWPAGTYYLCIEADGRMLFRKPFEL